MHAITKDDVPTSILCSPRENAAAQRKSVRSMNDEYYNFIIKWFKMW